MLREAEVVLVVLLVFVLVAAGTVLEVVVVVVVGAVTEEVEVGEAGRALILLLLLVVVVVVVAAVLAAAFVLLVTFEPPLTAVPRLIAVLFVAARFSYLSLKLVGIAAREVDAVLAVVVDLLPSSGRAPREPEGLVLVAPTLLL